MCKLCNLNINHSCGDIWLAVQTLYSFVRKGKKPGAHSNKIEGYWIWNKSTKAKWWVKSHHVWASCFWIVIIGKNMSQDMKETVIWGILQCSVTILAFQNVEQLHKMHTSKRVCSEHWLCSILLSPSKLDVLSHDCHYYLPPSFKLSNLLLRHQIQLALKMFSLISTVYIFYHISEYYILEDKVKITLSVFLFNYWDLVTRGDMRWYIFTALKYKSDVLIQFMLCLL